MSAAGENRTGKTVIAIDAQGVIVGVDADTPRMLGYAAAELIGTAIARYLAIDAQRRPAATPASILERLGGASACNARALHADGSAVPLRLSARRLFSASGEQLLLTLERAAGKSASQPGRDWEEIFDTLGWAIACSSDGQRISYATPAFAAMHGYTRDEMLGMPIRGLDPSQPPNQLHPDSRPVNDWGGHYYETTHRHRLGHTFPVSVNVATIYNGDGSIAYCLGHLLDISERKKMEEDLRFHREFLQILFDQTSMSMAVCTLDGHFISVNAALCDMLGYCETELLGLRFADITHPDDIGENAALRAQAIADDVKSYQIKNRLLHKNGRIVWTWLVVSLIKNARGETEYTIGQIIEINSNDTGAPTLRSWSDQRDTLIREVHHRTKNNLQAVTGLLRRQLRSNPGAASIFRQAITQVEAIAIVHGLHGTTINQRIRLCEMLCGIVAEINKLQDETHQLACSPMLKPPTLIHGSEAVPTALILNELITNAIKHHDSSRRFDVRITIARSGGVTQIGISNPALPLPAEFDFARDCGIGQGLKLVRAIIPKQGMNVEFHYADARLTTTVTLSTPIVYPEAVTA